MHATTPEAIGPEAEGLCQLMGCGAEIREYNHTDKSVQVGAVGGLGNGFYKYEALSHD